MALASAFSPAGAGLMRPSLPCELASPPRFPALPAPPRHRPGPLLLLALQEAGCYKVILDCSEENVPFYEKCGLIKKEVQMVK